MVMRKKCIFKRVWITHIKILVFILGLGLNVFNLFVFKFINLIYISKIFFYDSLINLNFLNYFFFFIKKILTGKRYCQSSILKKTLYLFYFLSLKKYKIISRLKCGDVNFFSRINNDLIFLFSNKIIFYVLNNFSTSFYSFNILNFFLTYRFNFSNIIFITYLNFLNIFKMLNCFLNKVIIYYMINNNILFFFNFFKLSLYFYYLIFLESLNFFTEHLYIFNIYDLFIEILDNFLIFKLPKYLIINNFFKFLNIFNFLVFLF